MKRLLFPVLKKWKDDSSRKPLLLRGARQVGKTWIARELGKQFPNFIEINFELYPEAKKIFQDDLDPHRIIRDLSLLTGKQIDPGEALLFLDEIQEEPKVLQSLRYFFEILPEQHVIAAGSLIDFELEKIGMPVGRVVSVYLHPLSFIEFLSARNEFLLVKTILNHDGHDRLGEPIHNKLLNLLGEYMAVGGMPEVVAKWCDSEDLQACIDIHYSILDSWRQDFNKYAKKYQSKYVEHLFNVIPSFLSRVFKFDRVPGNYRKRELQPALDLLEKAGLVQKITHSAGQGLPLAAQAKPDLFKLIFLDVALAQSILGLERAPWILDAKNNLLNKGAINEAFVGQELLAYSAPQKMPRLYFWQRQARSSSAEVDYLVQQENQVIPVEVKSTSPGQMKSLRIFQGDHASSPYGVRFSALNYAIDDNLRSYPLYAVAGFNLDHPGGINFN